MNNEIKEALEEFKSSYYNEITHRQYELILDYITNLQERNNNLKEDFKRHIDRINELTERNEKAIEYIKAGKTFDNEDVRKMVNKIQKDLLNILQGSDK